MSDRWVFATAFLTVVLVVAGAFAIPQYFSFELARASIFVAIAILSFFGEDKYSYMLGVIAPLLGFLLNILLGGFFGEFTTLWAYITRQHLARVDTPLHGFAILTSAILVVLCFRAFRKQVPEKFFGRTFVTSLVISLAYVGVLAGWYYFAVTGAGQMP
jgi:hypothetical protein